MATSAVGSPAYEKIIGSLDRLPPFSPVMNRLLASLASEDVSLGELAALIETDTVLAGNILRVVNSPLYGRRATINSVRHAVALIGQIKIRNLVLGLSVSRKWAAPGTPKRWSPRQFNLHSLAVAVMADLLVLEVRQVPYPEGAFVAGLLHDIGKLLIAIAAPDDLERVYDLCQPGNRRVEECEREVLQMAHPEVSGIVLERWNLPKPIRDAVAAHHDPASADAGHLHLAYIIQAADGYVNESGIGMAPYAHKPGELSSKEMREFGLLEGVEKVAEGFKSEFEALCSVL